MSHATISALHLYPVKGCRGVSVHAAAADVRGLASGALRDREWMIVDRNGRFVSQREYPRVALIGVAIDAGAMTLRASQMRPVVIPLPDIDRAPRRDVVVWRSTVAAIDAGDDAARWLSDFIGMPVRLVRFAPEHVRKCNVEFVGTSGAHTMFADGYPILVIGEGSLADLNARLAEKREPALPMNRFRPNIVVSGLEPYDEDHVDTIEAAGIVLKLVKPCTRCKVPTTDQDTARVAEEPLVTLTGYRMNERLGGVTFGMNAIVASGAGRRLAVGMPATIEYRF